MKRKLTNMLTKQGLSIAIITAAALGVSAAALITSGSAKADTIAIEATPSGVYHETTAENDRLYSQPAAWAYKSTAEYRAWLEKINSLCKQRHNPADDKEGFWDCLEDETKRTPPPENHLEPIN
jgi:hypothetical protein